LICSTSAIAGSDPVLGVQDVGDDRAASAVAVDTGDALVEDLRGRVELAEHADVADLLESVDAGLRAGT
jgi:hypothetical protein